MNQHTILIGNKETEEGRTPGTFISGIEIGEESSQGSDEQKKKRNHCEVSIDLGEEHDRHYGAYWMVETFEQKYMKIILSEKKLYTV